MFVASTLIVVTSGMALSASFASDSHLSVKSFSAPSFQAEARSSQNLISFSKPKIGIGADFVRVCCGNIADNVEKNLCDGKCCFALTSLSVVKKESQILMVRNMNWPVTVQFLRAFATFDFERPPRAAFALLLRA